MEPQPIAGLLRHGRWTIETFERVGDPPGASAWLALPVGTDRLRVTVFDGRPLISSARSASSTDPSRAAVALARAALSDSVAVPTALSRVNVDLFTEVSLGPARPSASLVLAELLSDGRIALARAGAGDAFARFGTEWVSLFPPDPLRPEAALIMADWEDLHQRASLADRLLAEDIHVGSSSHWRSTPVGRFPEMRTERARADGADEIIVATEGARLNTERVPNLPRWTASLREWERTRASELTRGGRRLHPPIVLLRVLVTPISVTKAR